MTKHNIKIDDWDQVRPHFPREEEQAFAKHLRACVLNARYDQESAIQLQAINDAARPIADLMRLREAFKRASRAFLDTLSPPTGYNKKLGIIQCSDPRLRSVAANLGNLSSLNLTNVGGSVEHRGDPNLIGPGAAEFLALGPRKKIEEWALNTHTDCACIKVAANGGSLDPHTESGHLAQIFAGMARKKNHLTNRDHTHLVARVPSRILPDEDGQRRAEIMGIAHAEHIRELTQRFLAMTFPGNIQKVWSIHFVVDDLGCVDALLRGMDGKWHSVIVKDEPHHDYCEAPGCQAGGRFKFGHPERFKCDVS